MIALIYYDLIVVAGDDTTDVSMFRLAAHDPRILSIHVGDGETGAHHRVRHPADLRQLLRTALTRQPSDRTTGSIA